MVRTEAQSRPKTSLLNPTLAKALRAQSRPKFIATTVAAPSVKKLILPETHVQDKNCLTCRNFSKCSDPKKSTTHLCNEWTARPHRASSALEVVGAHAPKTFSTLGDVLSSKAFIETEASADWIDALLDRLHSETAKFPDFRINDGDFRQSPNFLAFILDHQRLGDEPFEPWARQIQIASQYFSEICWNSKCTNVPWAKEFPVDATVDDILDNVTFMEWGTCPKCKKTKHDFWQNGKDGGPYFELVGVCGQRASKSYLFALMAVYYLQSYIKLGNPRRAFGLGSVTLEYSFTAGTYNQAKKVLFDYFCNHINDNLWFRAYNDFLRDAAAKQGIDPDVLFRLMDTSVVYAHRHIIIAPQAPDRRNQRGFTRIGYGIDELGHIGSLDEKTAIKQNPDEIYTALSNSMANVVEHLSTLFDEGKEVTMLNLLSGSITSPRSYDDKACRLMREANESDDDSLGMYTFHYPTWEMNPKIPKNSRFLKKQRRTLGEVAFMRDFGAIPPKAANAFISDISLLGNCQNKKYKNPLILDTEIIESLSDDKGLKVATVRRRGPVATHKKILAIDAGHTKNSFAGCLAHYDGGVMVIDALFEIIPEENAPVSFHSARYDVIEALLDDWNGCALLADRWNSLSLLSELEGEFDDLITKQYSLRYENFVAFRADLTEGHIIWPKSEISLDAAFAFPLTEYPQCFEGMPVAHSLLQAATVEDVMGRKVDKGGQRTDDLFRAIVLAHWGLKQPDILDFLTSEGEEAQSIQKPIVAYSSNGSFASNTTLVSNAVVAGVVISGGHSR